MIKTSGQFDKESQMGTIVQPSTYRLWQEGEATGTNFLPAVRGLRKSCLLAGAEGAGGQASINLAGKRGPHGDHEAQF